MVDVPLKMYGLQKKKTVQRDLPIGMEQQLLDLTPACVDLSYLGFKSKTWATTADVSINTRYPTTPGSCKVNGIDYATLAKTQLNYLKVHYEAVTKDN